MSGWLIVAIGFATLGVVCAAAFWTFGRMWQSETARHDREVARLTAQNKELLATALNAQGVIRVDPDATQRMQEKVDVASSRRKVEGALVRLQREDAQKALDRDARVAAEIEEANRVARGVAH